MIVAIARQVAETLLAEAAAAHPRECCGLLQGSPGRIDRAVAAPNVAADPLRGFEIDPAALLRTHRAARAAGAAILGNYHSHPNGRAEPSARDAARAVEDGQLWLIVAAGRIGAWRVGRATGGDAHGGAFTQLQLEIG
jgi:desampylase